MKNNQAALCPFSTLKNNIIRHTRSISVLKSIFLCCLLLTISSGLSAQAESDYEIVDVEDELKKICWPLTPTSETEATTNKLKLDIPPSSAPASGGLASFRSLLTAVEVPNSVPAPTIEIYDLLGNLLIINGTTIEFDTFSVAAFKADSILGTTLNYHWVGYRSTPFQPDNQGIYYYNIFHRWYGGMPPDYHNLGGRQWNGDNSGLSNYSDTVFVPHPISASISQPISCYGANDGILQANVNPLNYYTFSIDGQLPTLNSTFTSVSAGTHTITITDSFFNHYDTIINLIQPPPSGSSVAVTNCGAYNWPTSNLIYNTSGTYFFTSVNNGCPQTDTLILSVTSSTIDTSYVTAYNFYTWPISGLSYASSGTYYNMATVGPGCQQISILNLTIINTPFNMNLIIDQPISCFGANDGSCQATALPSSLPYMYQLDGGMQVNASGFFQNLSVGTHTVCAINGSNSVCKTITFTNPPPLNVIIVTDSVVSCLGNDGGLSAIITGGTHVSQDYLTFWTNSANILLNPLPNNFDTSITGLPPGLYHLLVEDDNGCTKQVSKFLNAAPPLTVTTTSPPIQCYGGTTTIIPSSTGGVPPITYSMFGFPLGNSYPAGTYEITATDARGCTATTLADFGQPEQLMSITTTAECDSYYWSINGGTYTTSGTYFQLLTSIGGCNIMNVLNLTIGNNTSSSVTVSACNSYYWPLSNSSYSGSGIYTATSLNASGCTHTTTLFLTINQNTSSSQAVTACDAYTWTSGTGLTYTQSGMYTKTSINAGGCIHTSILNLTVNYSTTSSQSVTACNAYTWTSGTGLTYTQSGMYTKTSINAGGCIHTSILNLTVNYSTTSSQSVTACNAYTWASGTGLTYTQSGMYTKTSINAGGCIHTSILHLTVNYSTTSTTSANANVSYTWPVNSITYTVSGIYTATLLNAAGCDSILTLNLTITQIPATLNLRCFIEGYMDEAIVMQMKPVLANQLQPTTPNACDTIKVELHQANAPYALVHSSKVVMNKSGFSTSTFPPLNGNYYIVVKHRNAIETWSALPVFFGAPPVNYNFTNAAFKAFGNNQIEVSENVWAFYSGDVNQDENVDLIDLSMAEFDIMNFNSGFLPTDINGDGNVDLIDLPIVETNVFNFISVMHP